MPMQRQCLPTAFHLRRTRCSHSFPPQPCSLPRANIPWAARVKERGWTRIGGWVCAAGMASFAVPGARLGVVRPGGSARSGGERRSGLDLPSSVLFRRKNAFSRIVLSCAGAPGKVLVSGGGSDDLFSFTEAVVDTPEQYEELKIDT